MAEHDEVKMGPILAAPVMEDLLLYRRCAQTVCQSLPSMRAEGKIYEPRIMLIL